MRDVSDSQGATQGNLSPQDSSDAFVTAVPHQRIYPTLPSDVELRSLNCHEEGTGTVSVRVEIPKDVKRLPSDSSTAAESASSNTFITAVLPEKNSSGDDGTKPELNSHFQTALQPLDELTRRSLVETKDVPGSVLSPTVPVNYALQQLSEGKKDRATIRRELAEMCSEKVGRSSHDQEYVPQPQMPSEGAKLATHISPHESQSGKFNEKQHQLGKRSVQFEMPVPKRYCPGSEQLLLSSGSAMTGTPSTVHPVASQVRARAHMTSSKKQSQSWFSKLFRNK